VESKRIAIHTEIDRQGAVMRGDGDRLQQIVWNLLTNAVKFTPKGGEIFVILRRIDSDLELVVRDTGVGIAPEFLPRVFESFRQSDTSATRAHGGLGIGLSITQHLLELHGGSIEAHSDGLGRGATFTVRLPISPLVSSTAGIGKVPATSRPPPSQGAPDVLRNARILVVDDEDDARELLSVLLEASGAQVTTAASAARR